MTVGAVAASCALTDYVTPQGAIPKNECYSPLMTGGEFWQLERMSDQDLRSGLASAIGEGAQKEAWIVAHLVAIAARRLYLIDGFPCMYELCQKKYRMSEGEAFLRLNAAKLARRFPVVFRKLANREIHLSALRLLRKFLTPANHAALLDEASGKTKLEVLEMLARRFPRAGIDPSIRKLPALRDGARLTAEGEPDPHHQASLLPVSEDRYRLLLDVSRRFKDKLELAKALGRHANPRGDIEQILEQSLDLWLEQTQKRRFARTKKPRATNGPKMDLARGRRTRRRVARSTVREVTERDGMKCSFVSENGHRCDSQAFLQLHHQVPWARHGPDDAKNLTWLCAAHNQFLAEKEFGQEHMERFKKGGPPDPDQA